ncbi:MAG: L,D-transpeptidase [Coleofasciculaceae cyanobacterium]
MYININMQAVTVTVCLAGAAILTLINCSQTSKLYCQCDDSKDLHQKVVRADEASARETVAPDTHSTVEQVPAQSAKVLVVKRTKRTVELVVGKQAIENYPIAVGKPGWETPVGQFMVLEKKMNPSWMHPVTGEIIPPGKHNPMGTHWIGFWQNSQGQKIGFHGTNHEESIGKAASHGCLRMYNADIGQLYDQIELGTTVIIQ